MIGVGSMGAPACYFLAGRGIRVLGIEQFNTPHEFGSHAGQSRLIRKAYFEDAAYVPLLNRAYENWKNLERETGEQVYYQTGLAYFGKPDHPIIKGIKLSADLYNISVEKLNDESVKQRFPVFSLPKGYESLLETEAGFVTPEKALALYVKLAKQKGAEIHTNEKVVEWKKEKNNIVVITDKNTYRSKKLIISAGAWSDKIAPGIGDKIKVTRQFMAWVKPKNPADYTLNKFPCWLIADDQRPGCYYGFPVLPAEKFGEPQGLKLACNYHGTVTDADHVNRDPGKEEIENIVYALNKYLPGTFESLLATKVCLYSNTPDENFIIDKLPGFENQVSVACGFSGHGFKFASAVGEILADLALGEKPKQAIDFLNANRFSQSGSIS